MRSVRLKASGENLFVALLKIAPSIQELEPPVEAGQFSRFFAPFNSPPAAVEEFVTSG